MSTRFVMSLEAADFCHHVVDSAADDGGRDVMESIANGTREEKYSPSGIE